MAKLTIEKLDLSPEVLEIVKESATEAALQQTQAFLNDYRKKLEVPAAMNYKEAAAYLTTSYTTLKKLINSGLIKVILIDGYERISKQEADRFLNDNSK